ESLGISRQCTSVRVVCSPVKSVACGSRTQADTLDPNQVFFIHKLLTCAALMTPGLFCQVVSVRSQPRRSRVICFSFPCVSQSEHFPTRRVRGGIARPVTDKLHTCLE